MSGKVTTVLAAMFGIAAALAMPCRAMAQEDLTSAPISFGFNRTDVRTAIQCLFDAAGIPCNIHPEIRGKVSFSVFDAPWESSLQSLFRAEGITYRSESGVIEVVRGIDPPRLSIETARDGRVTSLESREMDAQRLLRALFNSENHPITVGPYVGGPVNLKLKNESFEAAVENIARQANLTYKVENGMYKFSVAEPQNGQNSRMTIRGADIRQVGLIKGDRIEVKPLLIELFRQAKVSYVIGPNVFGLVTLELHNLTFESVLKEILLQVGADFRRVSGVYVVKRNR